MYKYTRKECNKEIETIKRIFSGPQIMPGSWLETVAQYLHATQLMLLAQKEDKKECIHEGDKTDWHPQFCRKCGAEFMYDFTTPSPLEIEEIETLKHRFMSGKNHCWRELSLQDQKINSLIRNQKKLYQFIKEKQK